MIPEYLNIIIINDSNNLINIYLYYLFFIPLFSKLILKQEIYKHQYLSLIISIFASILISVPIILLLELNDIIPNINTVIRGVCYSLGYVLIKYVFNTFFISPYKLCLLLGILYISIDSSFLFIYSLIKYYDLSYFNDCIDFSKVDNITKIIICLILFILFKSTYEIFSFIVIFYFSPILYFVTDIIYCLVDWIIKMIQNGISIPDDILYLIGYIIILLSSLIYNEIIILNFCGLNKNTKILVEKRQSQESIELSLFQNDIVSDLKDNDEKVSVNSDYYLAENNLL